MSHHEKEGEQEDACIKTGNHRYPHPYISVCVEIFLVSKEWSVKFSGFQRRMDGV